MSEETDAWAVIVLPVRVTVAEEPSITAVLRWAVKCVLSAGAVVIEDVPESMVVAGCPARIIKEKDEGTSQKTALEAALRTL